VRKHLSYLKCGRLAALAYPATVLGLLLSDVIGDAVDVIGSGPTTPDSSTFANALAVLQQFELLDKVPEVVRSRLERGAAGLIEETPKPGDPVFRNVHNIIVGSNRLALEAAEREARELGYRTLILSSSLEGETREIASSQGQMLRKIAASGDPIPAPVCILSGGETTVTVRGSGKGGRNQEFALAIAPGIAGLENVAVLSAGTDGTDGPTDAAGAIATGSTVARAKKLDLSVAGYLANNDSYSFFNQLGDLVRTGPTGTNVMDIHVMLAG
jgi:glycerate 2-kinase